MRQDLATLIAIAALLPTPAAANGAAQVRNKDADAARLTMRDFADCVIKNDDGRHARNVSEFLAMSPVAFAVDKVGAKLADSDCLKSRNPWTYVAELKMRPQLLRGALFRSRFEKAFKGKPLPAFAAFDAKESWHLPSDDPFAFLQSIGECVVRADPVDTRAALEAPVASPAEDAAYRAIIPNLKPCIPANVTYRFSRTVLEGLFAEALYNLSMGAVAPSAATSGG